MAILKIKHNSQLFADLSAATSGVVAAMENAQVGEFWAGDYGTGAVLAFKGVNGVSVFSDATALTTEFKASLQNYYTKEEIDTLFNTKLSKYYTKDELDVALDSIVNSAISVVGGDGIIINGDGTEKTISTNVELEIKTVEGKEMIQLLDGTDQTKVLAEVDASKFVVDGMLSSAEIVTVDDETELPEGVELSKGKYIKLSWNTDSGKSDTYVPVADLISEHKVVAGEDVAGEFVVVATNVVESTDENGVKVSTVNVTVDDTAVKSALDAKIGKEDIMLNFNEDINQTITLSLDNPNYTIIGNSWVCTVAEEGAMAWCNFSLSYDNGEQFYTFPNSISYSATLTHNKPEDGIAANQIRIRYYSMETGDSIDEYINVNSGSNIILTTYANGVGTVITFNSQNTKEFNTIESIEYINDEVSTLKTNVSDLVETKIGKKDNMLYGQVDRTEYKSLTPQSPLISFPWQNWTAYLEYNYGTTQYEIIEGYEGGNVICVISEMEVGAFSLKKNGNKLEVRIGANVQSYDVSTYGNYLVKLTTTTDSLTLVTITYSEYSYLNTNESLYYLQNKKADKTDLELKADKTDLELKADKSDLELKADKSDLELKADKSDLDNKIGRDDVMLYVDTPLEVTGSKTSTFKGDTWEVTIVKTTPQINSEDYLKLESKSGFSTYSVMQIPDKYYYYNFVFDGTTINAYARNYINDGWQLINSSNGYVARQYYFVLPSLSQTIPFNCFIKTPANTSTSLNYLNDTKADKSDLDSKIGKDDTTLVIEPKITSIDNYYLTRRGYGFCYGDKCEITCTFTDLEETKNTVLSLNGITADGGDLFIEDVKHDGYNIVKYIYDNGILTRYDSMFDNPNKTRERIITLSKECFGFKISGSIELVKDYVSVVANSIQYDSELKTQNALKYLDDYKIDRNELVLQSTQNGDTYEEQIKPNEDGYVVIDLPTDEVYTKICYSSNVDSWYLNIGDLKFKLYNHTVYIACDGNVLKCGVEREFLKYVFNIDKTKKYSLSSQKTIQTTDENDTVKTIKYLVTTKLDTTQSIKYLNDTKISKYDTILDWGIEDVVETKVFNNYLDGVVLNDDFVIENYRTTDTNVEILFYDREQLFATLILKDVVDTIKYQNGVLYFSDVYYGDVVCPILHELKLSLASTTPLEIDFRFKKHNKLNTKESIEYLNEQIQNNTNNKLGKFDTVLSVNEGETITDYNVEGALDYLQSEIEAMNVIDCGVY